MPPFLIDISPADIVVPADELPPTRVFPVTAPDAVNAAAVVVPVRSRSTKASSTAAPEPAPSK